MALSYYRTVRTTAKGRWYGRKLGEVAAEFGHATLLGDPEHVVRNADIVEYRIHVHEPPVPALGPAAMLFEDDDFVVINKPSGIPVHPTVNYFRHTLTEMLRPSHGALLPCYRLDRLTSGVLVFGKTQAAVATYNSGEKRKVYLARVRSADVPDALRAGPLTATQPIVSLNAKRGYDGLLAGLARAKPAATRIELLSEAADGLATLHVEPFTGRTHQIRKHLALLGMPIHNDEVYADGGLFKAMCEQPSARTFDAVFQRSESARRAKLTGETCAECGAALYSRTLQPLDLHCARYQFGDRVFEAPSPF